MPIDDRLNKENVIHAHHGILHRYFKKKKRMKSSFAATWMQLGIIFLSELTQEQKIKYLMLSLISRS